MILVTLVPLVLLDLKERSAPQGMLARMVKTARLVQLGLLDPREQGGQLAPQDPLGLRLGLEHQRPR